MRYAIVIEKSETGYAAYVPDLPGCVATGADLASCRANIAESVKFHLEDMRQDGEEIPQPTSIADYIAA